ncbi:hypothetical protein N9A25_00590 [bacterium]|nr:hypothetical protein [bacterium]
MLTSTPHSVTRNMIEQAILELPNVDFKHTLNSPRGDFFYDGWDIKTEYKGTVWDTILNSLPFEKGEARLIKLSPGNCYQSHSDIDDRLHLTISSDRSYLVDIQANKLYPTDSDANWYQLDAGRLHSAVNFGVTDRYQLVVRCLLTRNTLEDPVNITLSTSLTNPDRARHIFDNTISPWLNYANKAKNINNFKMHLPTVSFAIERRELKALEQILTDEFYISTDD